jgi:hypothetical protein
MDHYNQIYWQHFRSLAPSRESPLGCVEMTCFKLLLKDNVFFFFFFFLFWRPFMYLFSIFLLLYLSHDTLLGKVYFFHFLIVLKRLIGLSTCPPFYFYFKSPNIFSYFLPPPPPKKKSLSVSFFPACSASHEAFLSFIFAVIFKLFSALMFSMFFGPSFSFPCLP